MSDQNNTPPPPEGELKFQMRLVQAFETHTSPPPEVELKFQMQAMTQIMERMNFVMGNVCDRLDSMEKRGNEAGISTQDMVPLGAEPKANSGNRTNLAAQSKYVYMTQEAIKTRKQANQNFDDSLSSSKRIYLKYERN